METRVETAKVPVSLIFPDEMRGAVKEVIEGEYEASYFGTGLKIVDVGANVGSFSIWANLRWPHSEIVAYEPHPETFVLLQANTEHLPNITCVNAAVAPLEEKEATFHGRYSGDGESGLATYLGETFSNLDEVQRFTVPVLHPRALPTCDILKVDCEGAEADIVVNADLSRVSLVMMEYQFASHRERVKAALGKEFLVEFEDQFPWDAILDKASYREDLKGDYYGRLFLVNRRLSKLKKINPQRSLPPLQRSADPRDLPLLRLLRALPVVAKKAVQRRFNNHK